MLHATSTAEEALLKRCSHFDLDTSHGDNAIKQCDFIVQDRQQQLDDCKVDLSKQLAQANQMQKTIGKTSDETMFQEYVRVSRDEGVGDTEASKIVEELLDEANVPSSKAATSKAYDPKKAKAKDDSHISQKTKDLLWELREKTHDLRRLTKELVGRVRSLRYFTVVRDLQKHLETPFKVSCPGCERDDIPIEEVAVLSSCGHTGCLACVTACADREECVYAASGSCKAAARVLNVIKGDTLGVDDAARNSSGKHFGMKLENMIHLIKYGSHYINVGSERADNHSRKEIPKNERILIFVQFPDLMKKVAEALTANKVEFLEIRGSATQKSKNLEKFQNDSKERVLLLNVMDESASGANLTSANHAIFLSPLLAPSQEIYDACETQAIGRLRRYGQTKHVHVYRYLTKNTIDEEIYEQRSKHLEKS
jgi:SNF2 family DNA or RNA helicase